MGNRSFFPVRSTFFYENLLGVFVNLFVAGMAMFPPVMRRKSQKGFNQFALDRAKEELTIPGTILGMHPEGTRNKDGDPYTFLRARPGIGEIALACPDVPVIPVFINGLSNQLLNEMKLNFFAVDGNEIDIVIGQPVDLSTFLGSEINRDSHVEAAEICLDAVRQLGQKQKQIQAQRSAL
jgi:1-acyl-sn-glycerol-3-phosphate acyltransferase